jgi:hypothetical protein
MFVVGLYPATRFDFVTILLWCDAVGHHWLFPTLDFSIFIYCYYAFYICWVRSQQWSSAHVLSVFFYFVYTNFYYSGFDIRWTLSLALKNICLGPLDASVFFHDVQEHFIHGLSVLMCPHRCVPTNQFCFASHKNNDQERKYLSLLVMKPFQLVVDSRLQHCR